MILPCRAPRKRRRRRFFGQLSPDVLGLEISDERIELLHVSDSTFRTVTPRLGYVFRQVERAGTHLVALTTTDRDRRSIDDIELRDPTTGRLRRIIPWSYTTPGPWANLLSPVLDDYVAILTHGLVHVVHLPTGQARWRAAVFVPGNVVAVQFFEDHLLVYSAALFVWRLV